MESPVARMLRCVVASTGMQTLRSAQVECDFSAKYYSLKIRDKKTPAFVKTSVGVVASTGIEPVSGASETLILSIVLRGQREVKR